MNDCSSVIGIISLIAGVISIFLAIYSIYFSHKESVNSEKNYNKTKELLNDIDNKADLIDRTIQAEQIIMHEIINKMLDKIGNNTYEFKVLTMKDIDDSPDSVDEEIKERIDKLDEAIKKIPSISVEGEKLIISNNKEETK